MAIVRRLAQDPLWEVWVMNRGNRESELPDGVHQIGDKSVSVVFDNSKLKRAAQEKAKTEV